jgi:protoporphyrinogen oxidase
MSASASPREVAPLRSGDQVVVIGAGPAGLTAGYLLATQSRAHVTVLEASDAVGGLSQTARYKDFRFDIGGHRFFTKIGPVADLWHELLGPEFIAVPRLSRIHYDNRFFDYPLKAGPALRDLGVWNALRIVASYIKWHYRPHRVEDTFEQWVTNRFGKRLYEIFFKTYTEKVWGLSCTEIRAEWAAQRIKGLSLARAILNATSLQNRPTTVRSLIEHFHYPRLGPGQLWEACRDRIVERGHRVLLRHKVERIDVEDGRAVRVHASTPDGVREYAADHVITTMPLRSLVRVLHPPVEPAVRAAADQLRYRDFILVALILRRADLFPDNWIYIHSPGVQVGRIQNFNNWSAAMNPVPGTTCLGMEYFCFAGDAIWTRSDADLLQHAAKELEQLGLGSAAEVMDGTVIRVPKAYPIYDARYREHLAAIRTCIDPIPNLHTIGRNGMHKYNNQDHSMLTAMQAVQNMQGAAHDIWDVNTGFEYHEDQRSEAPGGAACRT